MMNSSELRRKQLIWETPRNIAIIVGATAAIMGALGGFIGYKIGQTPPVVIQVLGNTLTDTGATAP